MAYHRSIVAVRCTIDIS